MKRLQYIILILIISIITVSCEQGTDEPIKDNNSIYKNNHDVYELYITITPSTDVTFDDLSNQDGRLPTGENIKLDVIIQEGKDGVICESCYGFGLTDPNATIRQRGQSSRNYDQKSFRVDINKGFTSWNNYKVLNLNKHFKDSIRVRNKLMFELFQDIPNLTSLRTNFVNLYIKDLSNSETNDFVDYGLFTNVENVDKDFLKAHGLKESDNLYKAENFEFYRYQNTIKLKQDPNYNKDAFEEILEIKGDNDHRQIIDMLDAVNNNKIHINSVIDKYFNRDNYITFLATNLILDNVDISSRNYYLYNPKESDKWYFLPWDYDKAYGGYSFSRGLWQNGIHNLMGNVLHRRFLMVDENLDDVILKIEDLKEILSEEKIENKLNVFKPIIREYLNKEPDKDYLENSYSQIENELEYLPKLLKDNIEVIYDSVEKPIPFFLGDVEYIGEYYLFNWDYSYDLQGDRLKYLFELSTDPFIDNVIYVSNEINDNMIYVNDIKPGRYYWRVTAYDEFGNFMHPFDYYLDSDTKDYFIGVKEVIITKGGVSN